MNRNKSLFVSVTDRSNGFRRRENIRRTMLGSDFLVRRLKCEHLFLGHEGCVNTVAWNEPGDVLLSGSDDCKLNLYRLSSMQPVHSIPSGHRANIFSAKFLPRTGDTKIVSCSGDGVLHYNDVTSYSFYGKSPFRCHSGTTYEVNTTPGDPHSFLSSGEDGTVRLFDLRTKTKCLCEGCKEDVLIDCGKAVTSFNINPVYPYYIAVGCENSTLRVYDRRSLTTDKQGKPQDQQHGFLYQFKPKELEKRTCRVTSLKYSSDGQSLLASFCSDHVYLFDANPKSSGDQVLSANDEPVGSCPHVGNDPPMKRLRLRGDWSDTGPNARPESEETESSENSFVQRMSGYLTTWIEESLRNARRQHRRHNLMTSRSRAQVATPQTDQRDEIPECSSAEENDALRTGNEDREHQETVAGAENDTSPGCDSSGTRNLTSAQVLEESNSTDVNHVKRSCSSLDSYKNDGKTSACTNDSDDNSSSEYSAVSITQNGNETNDSELMTNVSASATNNPETRAKRLRSKSKRKARPLAPKSENETEDGASDVTSGHTKSVVCCGEVEGDRGIDRKVGDNDGRQLGTAGVDSRNEECTPGNQKSFPKIRETVSVIPQPNKNPRESEPTRTQTSETRIGKSEISQQCSRTEPENFKDQPFMGSCRDSVGDSSESEDDDCDTRRNAAASKIQSFFRHRNKKDSRFVGSDVPVHCEARQIYKGHRNARTMIKEANFWGDDFVLSGSDCGRIFIWSRHTSELVMLLEGDRHVVNCVQPHPYDPILATSGIDYDIKLWTPTALKVCSMDDAKEVVARNEQMLRESRDTLTVPPSFLIRVLSSLHRVRFNAMGDDHSQNNSDSDWNEDE